jgi:hypothetical protein
LIQRNISKEEEMATTKIQSGAFPAGPAGNNNISVFGM